MTSDDQCVMYSQGMGSSAILRNLHVLRVFGSGSLKPLVQVQRRSQMFWFRLSLCRFVKCQFLFCSACALPGFVLHLGGHRTYRTMVVNGPVRLPFCLLSELRFGDGRPGMTPLTEPKRWR